MIYPIILYGTVFVILLDGVIFWLLINSCGNMGRGNIVPEQLLYLSAAMIVWGTIVSQYYLIVPEFREKEELEYFRKMIGKLLYYSTMTFLSIIIFAFFAPEGFWRVLGF